MVYPSEQTGPMSLSIFIPKNTKAHASGDFEEIYAPVDSVFVLVVIAVNDELFDQMHIVHFEQRLPFPVRSKNSTRLMLKVSFVPVYLVIDRGDILADQDIFLGDVFDLG